MEFATQQVTINDSTTVRAQIWDTAGQERYRAITNAYYRQAIGVLLVYDVTHRQSFESLGRWLTEVREHADSKVQIILVGNKSDMKNNR
jgi:small GTP-binding protein